jgi:hypothetical protein
VLILLYICLVFAVTAEDEESVQFCTWHPVDYTTPTGHVIKSLFAFPVSFMEGTESKVVLVSSQQFHHSASPTYHAFPLSVIQCCGVAFLYSAEAPPDGSIEDSSLDWNGLKAWCAQLSLVSIFLCRFRTIQAVHDPRHPCSEKFLFFKQNAPTLNRSVFCPRSFRKRKRWRVPNNSGTPPPPPTPPTLGDNKRIL